MTKLKVVDLEGKAVGDIEVSDAVFATEVKEHLLWEAVRWQRAKKRSGNAKTKERGEIRATKAKMYKQKGTGNARHGNKRVVTFRGGGVVHGPRVRSYEFSVNKKARAGALRSALSLRAQAGDLLVVKDFVVPDGKTKNLAAALDKLETPKALLVDSSENTSLSRSSKNLSNADFLDGKGLNVYSILRRPKLLISETALREVEARLGGGK